MLPPGASASAPPLPLLSPPPPSPRLGPSPEASPLLRPAAPPPARSNRSTGSERGTIAVPVNGRGVRRPSSPRSGEQHRRSAPSGSSFEPMSRSKTARMSVTCRKSASEHEKRSRGSSASHQLHVSSAPSPPKPADGPRTEPPITARHALASPVTAVPSGVSRGVGLSRPLLTSLARPGCARREDTLLDRGGRDRPAEQAGRVGEEGDVPASHTSTRRPGPPQGCGAGEWDARVAAAAQVGGDDALQGEGAEPGARGCGRLV